MIITTDFGYPILRHRDEQGNITWYYPEVPTEYRPDIIPRLLKGIPTVHIHDDYRVCLFTVENSLEYQMPIVLSVTNIKEKS